MKTTKTKPIRYMVLVMIFIIIQGSSSNAQSLTLTIGTGTSITNGGFPDPIDKTSAYMHTQLLYTATELTTGGMAPGAKITKLGFSISEAPGALANYTISMGHTAYTSLGIVNYVSNLAVVKGPYTYTPTSTTSSTAFDMITFDTPFIWDGISNIVVNTCTGANTPGTPNGGVRYTATPGTNTIGWIRYATPICTTPCNAASYLTNRPNIKFVYTNPATCIPISTLPWTENFDSIESGSGHLFPLCWKGTPATTSSPWECMDANGNPFNDPYSGSKYLTCSRYPEEKYAFTPGFALIAGVSYDFSFKYAGDGNTGWNAEVRYNTTQTETGSTILGPIFLDSTSTVATSPTYTTVTRTFIAPSTGTYYFMVHVKNKLVEPRYLGFDDFRLEPTPVCFAPTTIAVSYLTSHSATIAWTPASPAPMNGYDVEVRTSGAAGSGATGLITSGSPPAGVSSVNINGLTPSTTYYVYIRSNCGSTNGISYWSNVYTLTTLCPAVNVPYIQNFSSASPPNIPTCTSQENAGTGNIWNTNATVYPYMFPSSQGTYLVYNYNATQAANAWWYTPGINLVAGETYRLSYLYGCHAALPERMKIAVGQSTYSLAMNIILVNYPNITVANQRDSVCFTPDSSGVYYFGFNCYSSANMDLLQLDDIKIDIIMPCNAPTNVVETTITSTSLTISWTGVSPTPLGGYEWEIRTSGASGSGPIGLTQSGTTSNTTIYVSGLAPQTHYFVYVRSNCSGN